jgi:glycosyltransferase involved in cell wall biosynthesis
MESVTSIITKKSINDKPLKILFCGWINIPHSYAVVFCFQLIHLYKNYGPNGLISKNKIEFYIDEMPYYRSEWNTKKKLVYKDEYNKILKNFKIYNGQDIDLIYRQTYPYNITVNENNKHIPKCIFYTSEFKEYLTPEYFTVSSFNNTVDDNYIKNYLDEFNNIYFTSPSEWSSKGMNKYNINKTRNRVITHGIDPSIFKRDYTNRNKIRTKYNVKKDDILLFVVGSMTTNKGIILILQILNILVHKLNKTNYKLLLKGTGDLYQCKNFLEQYFDNIVKSGEMSYSDIDNLYKNYIIFTDKTISYSLMNDLYNSSDLCISPYLCEGYNLVPHENLGAGCDVLLPITGSTKEYAEDIYNNGGSEFIHYVNSKVITLENGMSQNHIELQDLLNTILSFESKLLSRRMYGDKRNYTLMRQFIINNLSWDTVSKLLVDYFEDIIYRKI